MDFSFLQDISFANLFDHGFNALKFSLLGMSIVFGGLTFISLYIALLPKILAIPKKWRAIRRLRNMKGADKKAKPPKESDLMMAIAIAIHFEMDRAGGDQRITWKRHDSGDCAWRHAGRIQALAVRRHFSIRK